jgi:hypothetical protein
MSAPLRFLAVVAVGWVAFRVGTISAMPGSDMFSLKEADAAAPQAQPPVVAPAQSSPPTPEEQAYAYPGYGPYGGYAPPYPAYAGYPPYPPASAVPVRVPVYYPAYYPIRSTPASAPLPERSSPLDLRPLSPAADWDLAQLSILPGQSRPAPEPAVPGRPAVPPKFDRLQLSSWALLRGQTGGSTLASGSTLGGSQAGARLTYAFNRQLAAQLRTSSPVGGGRGFEVALGARYQPLRSLPVWINAERRQSIGDYGRSDFALFAEGGLYQRPGPWKFLIDAYLQGGVVGIRDRDLFVDGAFTATRPVFRNYSAGFGVWGGAQPGLYRVDVGPRISMKVRNNVRVHADWRQRLAGKADPGSGPALTLAADF